MVSNSRVFITREKISAATIPTRQANGNHAHALHQHHAQHFIALRAQRHANADLPRSLAHHQRGNAAQPCGGDRQRQTGKQCQQQRR